MGSTTDNDPLVEAGTPTTDEAPAAVERAGTMAADASRPAAATRPAPALLEILFAWLLLASVTAVANLVLLGIARAADASMVADVGFTEVGIGAAAIVAASYGTLLTATAAWGLVAHRTPAFAHLWVPLGWGVGLVSLAGLLGVSDLSTGITLGAMHLLTTAVATLWLPRRLPR